MLTISIPASDTFSATYGDPVLSGIENVSAALKGPVETEWVKYSQWAKGTL